MTLDSHGAAPPWLGDRALGWKAWLGSDSCCCSVIRTFPDGTGPGWVQMPRSLGTEEASGGPPVSRRDQELAQ